MEKRLLGKTGEKLSIVGFGGIVVMNEEPASAARLVAQAVERGVNYFDVAPSYGNAQEKLGPALEPYRKNVFLACKTEERLRAGAEAALSNSLRLLRTDHFDLYQLHGVSKMEEVEQITGPGGALEAFVEAQRQGKVRFLGFSAHSEEAALALMDRFSFASVLFPFNWVLWNHGFGPAVVAGAEKRGVGRLALKSLARRPWREGERERSRSPKCWYCPAETAEEAALALRFTLSRPITAAVSPSHAELLWWACDAADRFTPLSQAEEAQLAQQAAQLDTIFPEHE